MKVYQSNEIKNISLLGSSGSGKTTLVEAMLYESGIIKRRGSVAAQNTVSDYFPVEKELWLFRFLHNYSNRMARQKA